MSDIETRRLPPEIVFVPPPGGPGMPRKRIFDIAVACIIGGALCLVITLAKFGTVVLWVWIMIPIYAVVAGIVAVRYRQLNTAYQTQRSQFVAKHPGGATGTLVAALGKAWKDTDRAPKLDDVRAAILEVEDAATSDRARIVCFGEPDVPTVGELHFEPEIITPTGTIWRQLIWLVIAAALVLWWLCDYMGVTPVWLPGIRSFAGGLMYFIVAGAIALAVWIWRGMIRPRYLRMAPGIVQVLVYGLSARKPAIRSYPMEAGTLAVFVRIRKSLTLTLSRDDHRDVIPFSRMHRPAQCIEQVWRALLSTAPTPPLSDEELVG